MTPPKPWVEVGKVLKEWGLQGELKCVLFNAESDLPSQITQIYLLAEGRYQEFSLEGAKRHGEFWRMKFRGLETPEAAKAYRGATLALPRENLPQLEPGEIYLTDLVGLQIEGPDGKPLGKVVETQQVGESDILWIETEEGARVPIPYEQDFIVATQISKKKILLSEMALELFEINQS